MKSARLSPKMVSALDKKDIEELDFVPYIDGKEIHATVGFKIKGLGWFYAHDYKFTLSHFTRDGDAK
jgi:hypothetical protein